MVISFTLLGVPVCEIKLTDTSDNSGTHVDEGPVKPAVKMLDAGVKWFSHRWYERMTR